MLALAGFWCVITHGNRGALLVLVIYAGLYLISNILGSPNASRKVLKIGGVLVAVFFIIIMGDVLLDYMLEFLVNHD